MSDSAIKDVFTIRPKGLPEVSPVPGSVTPVRVVIQVEHAEVFRRDTSTGECVLNVDLSRDQIVALYSGLSRLDYQIGLRLPVSAPGNGEFQRTIGYPKLS